MQIEIIKGIKSALKKNDELAWRLKLINMQYNRYRAKHDNDSINYVPVWNLIWNIRRLIMKRFNG